MVRHSPASRPVYPQGLEINFPWKNSGNRKIQAQKKVPINRKKTVRKPERTIRNHPRKEYTTFWYLKLRNRHAKSDYFAFGIIIAYYARTVPECKFRNDFQGKRMPLRIVSGGAYRGQGWLLVVGAGVFGRIGSEGGSECRSVIVR